MCKFSPYTTMRKTAKPKKIIFYLDQRQHTKYRSTWASKFVFISEPQDRKSSDPRALGAAQFSNDTNDEYSPLSTQKHENICGNVNETDPIGPLFMFCSQFGKHFLRTSGRSHVGPSGHTMLDSERNIVKQKSEQGNVLCQHKPHALPIPANHNCDHRKQISNSVPSECRSIRDVVEGGVVLQIRDKNL